MSSEEKLCQLSDDAFSDVKECLMQMAKSKGGIRIKLLELLEQETRRRQILSSIVPFKLSSAPLVEEKRK
jgi:hypothetical protein